MPRVDPHNSSQYWWDRHLPGLSLLHADFTTHEYPQHTHDALVIAVTEQGGKSMAQCLVFAWIEGNPRKNAQAFACDDVAATEKWKTDQALKSAWR